VGGGDFFLLCEKVVHLQLLCSIFLKTLSDIQEVVKSELQKFEPFFRQQLQSPVPLLSAITAHIHRSKGKQLRPLLVFLSAKLNGEVCQKTYVGATLVELLHTATLIHDDVVDDANERRNLLSVNALWNSRGAVLAGDFLLSRGVFLSLEHGTVDLLHITSKTITALSEGELQQMERARKLETSEEDYFDIIRKKTASLIQCCTHIGAASVNASAEHIEALSMYGMQLGIAFQLRDDVLDYHGGWLTGKALGNDIREKKITLPLIYALQKVGKSEQRRILSLVACAKKNSRNVKQVVDFVTQHGGITYANNVTRSYCEAAKKSLDIFPESEVKAALCSLADYVVEREK